MRLASDACAREPLWAAPEAEELPAEFPFKATYQADEIQRRLCLEYEPRGAAGKFEEGYCAENRKRVCSLPHSQPMSTSRGR